MTDNLDPIRDIMASPEDVDLPPDLAAQGDPPDDGAPPVDGLPPGPDDMGPPREPSAVERCAELPLHDIGNARRVVIHFGEDLMFVPRVGWFVWDGRRWAIDSDLIETRRRLQTLTGLIEQETHFITVPPDKARLVARKGAIEERRAALAVKAEMSEEERAEDLQLRADAAQIAQLLAQVQDRIGQRLRHAKQAGNSKTLENMRGEAETMLMQQLERLDADAMAVNTESGVLIFSVSGGGDEGYSRTASFKLVPHSRDQLITKMMPVAYDPDARCPRFDGFLQRIMPAADMRRFLQRWYGLSMTAIPIQKLIFQYGSGANGKSVLTDLMARIMGDYAAIAKIETLTGQNKRGGGDATPDLMALVGANMARAAEPDEGMKWQEGLIKQLTGGEPVLVRAPYQTAFFEYVPRFKLTISGNHKPVIHGSDDGIWRRLLLVPFDVQIPESERLPKDELDAILWEERAGILNWLVEGLVDYLEGGLQEPQVVLSATAEFRADSDPVGAFVNAVCHVTGDPEDSILARELGEAFNLWLDDSGLAQWSPSTVQKRLAEKAERWRASSGQMFRKRKSSGIMRYDGLRFQDAFGRRFREMPRDSQGRILRSRTAADTP